MTIRYQCTECDSVLKIRDDKAGGQGRCPKCKTEFLIPEPNEDDGPEQDSSTPAAIGQTGDEEEDALAFLLDGGDTSPPTAPAAASTSLDSNDEPPPSRPDPAERELRRPPVRPQASTADTASAAGDLLSSTESARAAVAKEKPAEEPRIDLDGMKQVASRQVPLIGGILAMSLICYVAYAVGSGWVSGSGAPPLSNVTGTITLDGKPLNLATVVFQPDLSMEKGEGKTVSASMGRTNDQGSYTLTYPGVEVAEGAVVGTHIIRINKTDDKTGLEILPKKYHLKTELKKEVKAGSNTIDFELASEPAGSTPPPPNLKTGTR
ncbi:MAG: hypothetical protein QF363_00455 [Planctomycetaceae bacterium]|nr:hypothetical protein [Planctomycetaceae bacterium]